MNVQGGMGQMQLNIAGMPQGVGVGMPPNMGGPPGMQGPMPGVMPGGMGGMPGTMQGGMPVMSGGMQGPPGTIMQGQVVMTSQGAVMHASPQNPNTPGQIMQAAQQQQQPPDKLDNISKVKSLIGPLRESLNATLKTAGQSLHQNNLIDAGTIKGVDTVIPRFDKHIEEFFSICDQIEINLKTASECISQAGSSNRYMPFPIALTRTEPISGPESNTLTYPQYLSTARNQIMYSKEIHDSLMTTAQNIATQE